MIKHTFLKFIIKIHMSFVNLFRRTKTPVNNIDKFKLPIDEFNRLINTYPYKWDPLHGLIDIVGNPDSFFEDKKYNRDCDNFANVICVNGIMNGYKASEYVVTNPKNIKTFFNNMHIISILEKDGEFILGNYRLYRGFKSLDDALAFMKNFESYKQDILIVKSRDIKLYK